MGCNTSAPLNPQETSIKSTNTNELTNKSISNHPNNTVINNNNNDNNINKPINTLKPSQSIDDLPKSDAELNTKQFEAILRIQRQARRKKAIKKASAEQQWKIFADLDTKDEADMLHLAMFFQTLLDRVPGLDKYESTRELSYDPSEDNDNYDTTIYLDNIQIEEDVTHVKGDYNNFDIGKVPVTPAVALEIIEVCRRGGKLHFNTIIKILRGSYKYLKTQANVKHLTIEQGQKVTVVGDLHGNLADLLYILDESGFPSSLNRYVFNGDYVDRGEHSVEVICILLALLTAEPENVFLNRGNHEDEAVCRVYGFQNEVIEKYNMLAFEMFTEVFKHLPLITIISNTIFVVHGGLFHDKDVEISKLNQIVRTDYIAKPEIEYPDNTIGLTSYDTLKEYHKQLQRDCLWSDPSKSLGISINDRGAGMAFGPDIAKHWMNLNNISMVIRSHECVYHGFNLAYYDDSDNFIQFTNDSSDVLPIESLDIPLLCTLFSASNYCHGDNYGAYLTIYPHAFGGSIKHSSSGLYYIVRRYKTSESDIKAIEEKNKSSLTQLILRKKVSLSAAFEAIDENNTGFISRTDWAEIMQRVTQIRIRWLSIIDIIAPSSSLTSKSVNYREFLQSISIAINIDFGKGSNSNETIAAMYAQRGKLEAIFNFFDTNGDGSISREEFHKGCEALNASMASDENKLTDIDKMLDLMDFDGSDSIDINEFLEVFRILDAKDGKVDGVISLAKPGFKQ